MKYESKRLKKLAGILTEEFAADEQIQNWPDENTPDDVMNIDELGPAKEMLFEWPAWLRAIHLWFHGAHHAAKGIGFSGDHATLYDKIYTEVQIEVDGAIEKVVGLCNDEDLACPTCLTKHALVYIEKYKSPTKMDAEEIPKEGLKIIRDYISYIENCKNKLEEMDKLSFGLEDALGATCNAHETYVYLLQQRSK